MALNASKVKSQSAPKNFTPLEAGNYLARLVQVIDLGMQKQRPYQGQEKPPAHEVMLTYELGTEFVKDENGNDQEDKPRWISESIPLRSLEQDLAKSTKRIKALDPKMECAGDLAAMVGLPCTVTVVTNPDKKDPTKIYTNVGNVTPPMKGIPVPELVNPPKVLDLDVPDMEVFESLPEWVQDKIKNNLEYAGSALQAAIEGGVPAEKNSQEPEEVPFDEEDEDSPY